jgi:hypothetical protein
MKSCSIAGIRPASLGADDLRKDSNHPICGIHNVPLVTKQLPPEMIGGGYKNFTYLVCPVTGTVLDDREKEK